MLTRADKLAAFVSGRSPQVEEVVSWNSLQLRIRTYLCDHLPPLALVTSVRAVVLMNDNVVVVRDPESVHILPGGRRKVDETLLQTLRREILEETGWMVTDIQLLGIKHFQHLSPRPEAYIYPYPDFVHVVYAATAQRYLSDARESDGYELDAQLYPIADVRQLPLSQSDLAFLDSALSGRR